MHLGFKCDRRWLVIAAFFWTVLSPCSALGARFSLLHDSFDGGGRSAFAGPYSLDSAISPYTGGGHLLLLNDPPSPVRDYLELPSSGFLTIPSSSLLANDSDFEEDGAFSLALLGTNTTQGGVVTLENGMISYAAPTRLNSRGDSFYYIISDRSGAASLGTVVLVSTAAAPRLIRIQLTNSSVQMFMQALPHEAYMLQIRSTLQNKDYWRDYPDSSQPLVQVADSFGSCGFSVPLTGSKSFFRAVDLVSYQKELRVERVGKQLRILRSGVPGRNYKLQFRSSFDAEQSWYDFPNPDHALITRAGTDGFYDLRVPLLDLYGFYRTVPFFENSMDISPPDKER